MAQQKKIVVSFDYHNDGNYRNLLSALRANSDSDLIFEDLTPTEIQSSDVAAIKRGLSTKISLSDYLLTLVGDHANSYHADRIAIGERNWQWWEINKAKSLNKKLIAVKLRKDCSTPPPLLNSGATWALSFNVVAIINAVRQA